MAAMDLRRLRAGEWIAALGGAALLGSLFLPWYAAGTVESSAWEALAATDILLAVVAAFAVSLFVVTATQRVPAVPIALAGLVTFAGIVGLVLVLVRTAWLPDFADSREWGIWLGLAGALAIVIGGWLAMHDERLSKPGRPTDATGRPGPPPPEIEAIPAPRP
jgi:hypothetical protein